MDWTGEREHNPKTWPKGGRAKAPSPTKAKACILPAAPWIFIFTNAKGEYLCSNIWVLRLPGGLSGLLLCFSAGISYGQTPPIPPQIGSPNTVTADPAVPRPRTAPCVVPLFVDYV